ncbi:DUF6891 domain-containing protein [Polyangium jinanense]|uniref:DUF6891 domain-containing protein n=1 Tax=Polyangium jinanense TaxID=2829994 RepID=UPI00355A3BC8
MDTAASIATEYAHQLNADALRRARILVRGTAERFKTLDGSTNYILACASEAAPEVVAASATNTFRAYCRALWSEDFALEQRWTDRTTNDAIDEAFTRLDRSGIVAMQNAGGTQAMGWAEVNARIASLRSKKKKVLGAVFYHSQDVERGVEGEGLLLTFGALDGTDESASAVANAVLDALRAEGVACEWSGEIDARIRIAPFAWKMRRWTKPPARQTPVPWRTFVHPDGRVWSVAGLNNRVCVRMKDIDGDILERQTASKNIATDVAALTNEQLAEGFTPSESSMMI